MGDFVSVMQMGSSTHGGCLVPWPTVQARAMTVGITDKVNAWALEYENTTRPWMEVNLTSKLVSVRGFLRSGPSFSSWRKIIIIIILITLNRKYRGNPSCNLAARRRMQLESQSIQKKPPPHLTLILPK